MRAKEIALRLDHIGRTAPGAHHVKPRKARRQGRQRQPVGRTRSHRLPQPRRRGPQLVGKERRQQEPARTVLLQSRGHVVEHAGADDAPRPPNPGNRRQRQIPAKLFRSRHDQRKPLRIAQDFAGNHRLLQRIDAQRALGQPLGRRAKHGLAQPSLVQPGRHIPRHHRRFDHRDRSRQILGLNHRPAAGALLTRLVQNHIQHRMRAVGGFTDGGGNLDQIALQRALVPAVKHRPDLCRSPAQPIAHHAVNLGNHLHIGIFDAIMHRFDEMPRAARTHPGGTSCALILGRNCLQHRGHPVPIGLLAAAHDRGAMARTLFAARHAHAKKMRPLDLGLSRSPVGVVEIRVACVDDQIIRAQQGAQSGYLVIDHRPRRHHQNDRPWGFNRRHKIGQRVRSDDPRRKFPGIGLEGVGDRNRPVPHRNVKALFGDVQGQAGAHGTKANQPDLRVGHGRCTPLRFSASM